MQNLTAIRSIKFCWICGRAVPLENGKTDEHGNIVHEDCYTARLKLNAATPRVENQNRPPAPRKS
jgi:hypothetical protein